MRILMVIDKQGSAISRLADGVKKYNPHLHIDIIAVHPKRPDLEQLEQFESLVKQADLISFEYWKTYLTLKEFYPELMNKKKILAHYNPYNLFEDSWDEFDLVTTCNIEMAKKLKTSRYIPLTIDAEKFPFNKEYNDSKTVIMVSGRIESKKGVLPVAQACKELGYKLLLVGSISKKDYFDEVMATGCVEFREKVSDEELLKAYHESAIHVCNSIDGYESGCYDDQTEILTDDGWKLFKDLNKTERVATLNPQTNKLEFHKPYKYIEQDNWKELHTFSNQSIDYAVTPNHNMWISRKTTGKDRTSEYKPYELVRADELPTGFKIQRTCSWTGNRYKEDDKNWFRFMGIWLAEGSVYRQSKNSCRIAISAVKEKERGKIRELLTEMEINFQEKPDKFVFSENQNKGYKYKFGSYLEQFGHALDKFVPKEILNAKSSNINEFLEWFSYGDGSLFNGNRIFYTGSKKLADGLQECLIKIGNNSHISTRNRTEKRWIVDHWAKPNGSEYTVYEKKVKKESYVRKNEKYGFKIVPYNGKVYCVEVENHILLVRRNNKAMFCGNTMPLLEAMLTGCPVLTRNVGHVPDLYNEKNMVVRKGQPEDLDDLKNELKSLMENLEKRKSLRDHGWNSAKVRDDVRRARMYEKMWYEVLYQKPVVSIIIPTFNRIETLTKVIESVLIQDYPAIELVICDDGSTDNTEFLIKNLRSKISYPIKYINTKTTDEYNLAYARNLGAIEAIGEILLFLDDRYYLDEKCVSKFVEKLYSGKWIFGNKGKDKKNFVENFSCIYRDEFIQAGMFNSNCKLYGFLTQETRERFRRQNFRFEYVPDAKCEIILGSKAKYRKRDEIRQAKNVLYKMDF